jgi:hypothetical protein
MPGRWPLVIACVGLAVLPADLRRAARDRLLVLHGRAAQLCAGAPEGPLDPAVREALAGQDQQARLKDIEIARLRRALLEAGAAREVVEAVPTARVIPAQVFPLGAPLDASTRVLIHRGRQDGVAENQAVLAGDALVGTIARVTDTTAEVKLVTDPTFTIRATLSRASGDVEGMLTGDGTGQLVFQPAIQDVAAPAPVPSPGETIVASRESRLCGVPAVLGVVLSVERAPGAAVHQARVAVPTDLSRLGAVVVVQGTTPQGGAR